MGCASSKKQPVCRNCKAPVPRSYSMHVHHLPQKQGESYHVVALTSTTLGTLTLDPCVYSHHFDQQRASIGIIMNEDTRNFGDDNGVIEVEKRRKDEDFSLGLIEAKTWSQMIEKKIPKIVPKTPIRTPPGEPETINTWELMEGLEDTSPLHLRSPAHFRSFSFHLAPNSNPCSFDSITPKVSVDSDALPNKPKCLQNQDSSSIPNSNANSASAVSDFDPQVISAFRKALEELPPANPFHLKPLAASSEKPMAGSNQASPIDDRKVNGFKCATRGKDRLVLYFTSLRGVRKTYEDCCNVRVILKGLGIKIDERDVSIHSGFKEELKELLGDGSWSSGLPKVFLGRNFIGGAEDIKQLHEDGQLEKLLEGCETVDDNGYIGGSVCEACGDVRFVPCETCCGSCKVYYEGDYDEEFHEDEYGFQRCPDCNENGLVLCPICWD